MLRTRNASAGVAGARAGTNRRARLLLRVQQVGSTAVLVLALGLALAGAQLPAILLINRHYRSVALQLRVPQERPRALRGTRALVLVKGALFRRHLSVVAPTLGETLAFFALQPFLDLSYTLGLLQGICRLPGGSTARPID